MAEQSKSVIPTDPGWYWVRLNYALAFAPDDPEIVHVGEGSDGRLEVTFIGGDADMDWVDAMPNAEWLGRVHDWED